MPKSMLEVDGIPLIQRNVELLRDHLGIREVVIVVGHLGHMIQQHLGDGSRLGVAIRYVVNDRIDLNLPYSVYLGSREIDAPCCMILADEWYLGSNHHELLQPQYRAADAVCGMIECDSAKQIRKNYVARIRDGLISDLEEKPRVVHVTEMGTGTYLLSPAVLARLRDAFAGGPEHGPRDWTSWLGGLCRSGARVLPFWLNGRYVNVNSRDDLNLANYLATDATFDARTASLVYLVGDLGRVEATAILEFAAHPKLDEVLVVASSEPDGLGAVSAHPKVRLLTPPRPDCPIGSQLILGLDAAGGDMLILCYADGTFVPRDVDKFLVYLRDADLVMGTRTTRQMIDQGSNMRGSVRAAHVLLAKCLEIAYWQFESRFTDIACYYRALWRSTYRTIRPQLTATGPEVLAEIVIEVLRAQRRIIEIPITYRLPDVQHERVHAPYQTPEMFGRMLGLILGRRLEDSALARRLRHTRRSPPTLGLKVP